MCADRRCVRAVVAALLLGLALAVALPGLAQEPSPAGPPEAFPESSHETVGEAPPIAVTVSGAALAHGRLHLHVTLPESVPAAALLVVTSGGRQLGSYPLGPGEHDVTVEGAGLTGGRRRWWSPPAASPAPWRCG